MDGQEETARPSYFFPTIGVKNKKVDFDFDPDVSVMNIILL